MEIVVPDGEVEKIIQCVVKESQTGNIGPARFLSVLLKTRFVVRTGERGENAI